MDSSNHEEQLSATDATSTDAGEVLPAEVLPVENKPEAATRLLQAMALWVEGAGDPNRDRDEALYGWSARYAANFDRLDEPVRLDLAPVLGLPQGTPADEVVRIADEQEEDLIAQLIS